MKLFKRIRHSKMPMGTSALSAFVLLMVWLGSGCSPVAFNSGTSSCTIATPCLGADGITTVDLQFTINYSNSVDVLIVDDNSSSMQTEQANLATPFNGFISNLVASGLDWQIGVTSTDVCQGANSVYCDASDYGAYGSFLGPSGSNPAFGLSSYIITPSSNASSIFNSTIQRTETGSGDERAIYALNLAVDQRNGNNAGFFRNNSNLAVIILSDEDERSVGQNTAITSDPNQGYAPFDNYDYPQTFVNNVSAVWGNTKSLTVNSIIIVPGDTTLYPDPNYLHPAGGGPAGPMMNTCLNVQAHQPPTGTAHPGVTYQQLSQMTGGMVESICDNGDGSFANNLSQVITNIKNQANGQTITLPYTPDGMPSLTCTLPSGYSGADPCATSNWSISGTVITFDNRPPSGTVVNVALPFNQNAQTATSVASLSTSAQKVNVNSSTGQIESIGVDKLDASSDPHARD